MAHIEGTQTLQQAFAHEDLLNRITSRIRRSLDLKEILTTTVLETRLFLGTDRVKIYRFDPNGNGEVIAESVHGNRLPSLLGLRFPANDIPPHARELFVKARSRALGIVDFSPRRATPLFRTRTENCAALSRSSVDCHCPVKAALASATTGLL